MIYKSNKKELVCYESDASRLKGSAKRVFFPTSIKDVQEIVKNTEGDLVPRGSGTNLVGGCIPNNSIVVDLGKMNKLSDFSPTRKTLRVEAGITLKEINEKLNTIGLEFPIDIYNKNSTIGGMIAMNASGDRSMRYGSVKDWLEEIEFINGRGELVKTSKADLGDVCGKEGITGIIVGATIKLSPIVKRTLSAFQSNSIDEILSVSRRLRSEKDVVIIELFSPNVSKLLGLAEKYNLFVEFNSDRGKIKDRDYEDITKLRESVFSKLYSEGYYNIEDPKFFFDKIKDFVIFLEDNNIPYIGHLGVGIIHPFFKDNEKEKRERTADYIKKENAVPGRFGIGLTRKYLVDIFQKKILQRIKTKYDPFFRFNRGKLLEPNVFQDEIYSREDKKTHNNEPVEGEKMTSEEVLMGVITASPKEDKEEKGTGFNTFLQHTEQRSLIKKENQNFDYTQIRDIMTNKFNKNPHHRDIVQKNSEKQNSDRFAENEKDLIDRIINNSYKEKTKDKQNGS